MRVYRVESSGFCWGVAEAIDKALEISKRNQGPVYSYGPLVHNRQVMSELESQQIFGVDPSSEGIAGSATGTIVVRAHGVRPEVIAELEEREKQTGARFHDLTCPLVKMVHNVIAGNAKRGIDNVIVGDADHAEVLGLVGYGLPGRTHVVANPEQAAALPPLERVCVVSQTTQDYANFRATADVVRKQAQLYREVNTICRPTKERQEETELMARRVRTMVVVGGRHSANTVRLVELLHGWGCRPLHVETESELRAEDFAGLEEVGLTAGASTPLWMIERVEERLASFGARERLTLSSIARSAGAALVNTNLWVAAGAAGLAAAASTLQQIPLRWEFLAAPALFVMSMHTLNRFVDRSRLDFTDRVATLLYKRHPVPLLAVGAAAGLASVGIAALLGLLPFALALLGLACGCIYGMRVLPEAITYRFGIRRLKDFPASRDLSTAVGWAMMTAVLPFLTLKTLPGTVNLLTFLAVFFLVFLRTMALGVRDVAGDKIVGVETVFKALGPRSTARLATLMILALGGSLATLAFAFHAPGALALSALVPYVALYTLVFFRAGPPRGFLGELVTDGQNLVAGGIVAALQRGIF
ncbi:MAG: 4-hydroxy-3-methylbut-2-enyl diphosphate reductase [Candidatus Brocadiae bacterium]|nr:4-hydroxy-3-methylbut-2-enyl diphosphate reductase [Candidatus Brocadiia bacterium]